MTNSKNVKYFFEDTFSLFPPILSKGGENRKKEKEGGTKSRNDDLDCGKRTRRESVSAKVDRQLYKYK